MRFTFCLAAVLQLLLATGYQKAYSLPISGLDKDHDHTRKDNRRDASQESANIASIHGYVNEIYKKLNGPSPLPLDYQMTEANTMRSYENRAEDGGCGYYKFAVDKDKMDEEDVIRAELRLLQKDPMMVDQYDVDIYYLLSEEEFEPSFKLSFKQIQSTTGWKSFDLTSLVENWKQGWVNHGILVILSSGGHRLPCAGAFSQGEQNDLQNTQPLLIVFTYDYNSKFLEGLLNLDDTITTNQGKRHEAKREDPTETTNTTETNPPEGIKPILISCHLQELEINHTIVSIGSMRLVLPESFNAGTCMGHCIRLPIRSVTDHATIVSLYNYRNKGILGSPKRCCVPESYEMINMVFYNDELHEYIVKKQVPVKAATCGCL